MNCALFWSGGKDSLLALDRANQSGLHVTRLVNIYEGNTGRVRFHGIEKNLVAAQASALGLQLLQAHTHPQAFEPVFLEVLAELKMAGIEGIVFGNIHLEEVRAWYEQRTTAAGFQHVEPLWGGNPGELIREFVRRGHRARIASVNLSRGRREWLGREFSHEFIAELEALDGVDVCGECGEYHSYSFAGPLFHRPLNPLNGEVFEIEGHAILDLQLVPGAES